MVNAATDQKIVNVRVQTITPETASRFLQMNTGNRRLRKNHVDRLAESMARGEWKMNGDAIRIGYDGKLVDGQHRLSACVKSGIPFESIVVSGIKNDVFDTIDKGMKRQVADSLYVQGEVNTPMLAGAMDGSRRRHADRLRAVEQDPAEGVRAHGLPYRRNRNAKNTDEV